MKIFNDESPFIQSQSGDNMYFNVILLFLYHISEEYGPVLSNTLDTQWFM